MGGQPRTNLLWILRDGVGDSEVTHEFSTVHLGVWLVPITPAVFTSQLYLYCCVNI